MCSKGSFMEKDVKKKKKDRKGESTREAERSGVGEGWWHAWMCQRCFGKDKTVQLLGF